MRKSPGCIGSWALKFLPDLPLKSLATSSTSWFPHPPSKLSAQNDRQGLQRFQREGTPPPLLITQRSAPGTSSSLVPYTQHAVYDRPLATDRKALSPSAGA